MPIEYYVGVPGVAVDVRTPDELYDALDTIHTQVLDTFPDADAAPYIDLLERAMRQIDLLAAGKATTK